MAAAYQNFEKVTTATKCGNSSAPIEDRIQCLVGTSSAAIAGAVSNPYCRDGCSWTPVIDGVMVRGRTTHLAKTGRLRPKTPIIVGYNLNDGADFVPKPSHTTENSYTSADLKDYFAKLGYTVSGSGYADGRQI